MKTATSSEIGARIRKIRIDRGMNQVQFAKKIGSRGAYVSRYELGHIPPPDLLLKIARLGGVTVDWIFSGKHPKIDQKDNAA